MIRVRDPGMSFLCLFPSPVFGVSFRLQPCYVEHSQSCLANICHVRTYCVQGFLLLHQYLLYVE
jgi:hypothetical protein